MDSRRTGACEESPLGDVLVCWHLWVPLKLLCHLPWMVNLLLHRGSVRVGLDGLEGDAAVGEAVLMSFEGFDDLVQGHGFGGVAIPSEGLRPVDHPVQCGLVVEGELSAFGLLDELHQGIWTTRVEVLEDHVLLPVGVDPLAGAKVSESADQLVFAIRKVLLYLRHVGPRQVAVKRDHLGHAIPPRVLSKVFHPALLVILGSFRLAGLLGIASKEDLAVDEELVHPAGREV
mmetsp:Transcript_41500/g.130764  ORF Transcript_41500/g.130764 Transcript_41500/m.130764 type:complete len:231 (-) Transcript_41500:1452-2144(-)